MFLYKVIIKEEDRFDFTLSVNESEELVRESILAHYNQLTHTPEITIEKVEKIENVEGYNIILNKEEDGDKEEPIKKESTFTCHKYILENIIKELDVIHDKLKIDDTASISIDMDNNTIDVYVHPKSSYHIQQKF